MKVALNLSSLFFFTEKKPSNGNRLKVEAKCGILSLSFSRAFIIYKTKIPAGIGLSTIAVSQMSIYSLLQTPTEVHGISACWE